MQAEALEEDLIRVDNGRARALLQKSGLSADEIERFETEDLCTITALKTLSKAYITGRSLRASPNLCRPAPRPNCARTSA